MKQIFLLLSFAGMLLGAETRFYFVDVGHGNAAFVVAPSGEVMLLDAGPTRAAGRILAFMDQNGIQKIDYVVISHFEDDHMGAAPLLAEKTPIRQFVDHGESAVYGKSDDWWKQRRGPWFRVGMGQQYDRSFDIYRKAREKSTHLVVKAGDKVPVKGLDVDVVSADGKNLSQPLPGAGGAGESCSGPDRRADDDAEDGHSVGVVVRDGRFRFIYLGDLTWNLANDLFCPRNLVGLVDAYLVTHHAQSLPKELGAYYHGLSCCSAAEVLSLRPRVAVLSMGAFGHKAGGPEAMKVLLGTPGLDLWQTEYIRDGGEKGYNGPEEFAANIGQPGDKVPYIRLTVHQNGGFEMFNSRNGLTKEYPAASTAAVEELPITRLAGVHLEVSDLEKTREFYCHVLGFEEAFALKDRDGRIASAFFKVNDDQYLEFSRGALAPEGYRLRQVKLLAPDLKRLAEALRQRNLVPERNGKTADGSPYVSLLDPGQTELQFVEYAPESQPAKRRGKEPGGQRVSEHLQHAGIAAEESAAMAFYRDKLGFREFQRGGPAPNDVRWVNMMMPGTHGDYVELMIQATAPAAARQHICLEVSDIQSAYKQLLERGLPARFKPFVAQNHRWIMNVRDPNGIRVEFMGEVAN